MVSLSTLDDLIAEKSLLKHPFYVRWSMGELTLPELQVYAKEYYHLVRAVPGVVARVQTHTAGTAFADRMQENFREETEHIALWERFASSLGVTKEDLLAHTPSADVVMAVRRLEELAEQSLEQGVVAMYALERELAAIAQTKKEGLLRYYGLTSEDAHAYFDEHLREEKHLEVWRSMEVDGVMAAHTANASLDAQNLVLDGVCHAAGIPLHC